MRASIALAVICTSLAAACPAVAWADDWDLGDVKTWDPSGALHVDMSTEEVTYYGNGGMDGQTRYPSSPPTYTRLHNGLQINLNQDLSASGYSGGTEFESLRVKVSGLYFMPEPDYIVTGYRMTLLGTLSGNSNGQASASGLVYDGAWNFNPDNARVGTSFPVAASSKPFAWAVPDARPSGTTPGTALGGSAQADVRFTLYAPYSYTCNVRDDSGICASGTAVIGEAQAHIASLRIEALTQRVSPVPEPGVAWLALISALVLGPRTMARRSKPHQA